MGRMLAAGGVLLALVLGACGGDDAAVTRDSLVSELEQVTEGRLTTAQVGCLVDGLIAGGFTVEQIRAEAERDEPSDEFYESFTDSMMKCAGSSLIGK